MRGNLPPAVIGLILCLLFIVPAGFSQPTPTPDADLNNDGFVDSTDLLLFHQRWHMGEQTATATPITTPTESPTPTETPGISPNEITIVLPGDVTMEMVLIPAGSFMMGRYPNEQDSYEDEDPQHEVTIGYNFYMGRYEVTKAQWQAVMGTTPWATQSYVRYYANSPAVYVSWIDSQEFIFALNLMEQGTFRLPSESEWEYACRAGTETRFHWGDDLLFGLVDDYAWHRGNAYDIGEGYAHVVGQKLPNAWGLYDMTGNVSELCLDNQHFGYVYAPDDGSPWWGGSTTLKMLRGGSTFSDKRYCRSARRFSLYYGSREFYVGLRLVRDVE